MSDLNLATSRIDSINAKAPGDLTAEDIDALIAYHRANRARRNAGEKPIKPKVDLSKIMQLAKPKPVVTFTRKLP